MDVTNNFVNHFQENSATIQCLIRNHRTDIRSVCSRRWLDVQGLLRKHLNHETDISHLNLVHSLWHVLKISLYLLIIFSHIVWCTHREYWVHSWKNDPIRTRIDRKGFVIIFYCYGLSKCCSVRIHPFTRCRFIPVHSLKNAQRLNRPCFIGCNSDYLVT